MYVGLVYIHVIYDKGGFSISTIYNTLQEHDNLEIMSKFAYMYKIGNRAPQLHNEINLNTN